MNHPMTSLPIPYNSSDVLVILCMSFLLVVGLIAMAVIYVHDCLEAEEESVQEHPPVVYSNHPLLKATLNSFVEKNIPIGYFSIHSRFIELKQLEIDRGVLYCNYKGERTAVSNILASENKIRRPRWINYVYAEQNINYEIKYVLLKDYAAMKYNLAFL